MKIKLGLMFLVLLTGCSEENMMSIDGNVIVEEVEASEVDDGLNTVDTTVDSVKIDANPLTDIEHEYLDVMSDSLGTFTEKSTNISALIGEYESNPLIVNDVEWVYEIRGEFFAIKMFSTLLEDMNNTGNVPKRFEELHHYVYECFDLMGVAGDKMIESIDSGVTDVMINANPYISASDTMFEQVEKEIDSIELEISGE